MPSNTLTLQSSIYWAQLHIGRRPLALLNGGVTLEPALTSANIVIQTMLQPPFRWRWNRNTVTFSITGAGGSDYQQAVPDFGFIEKASVLDSGTPAKIWEVPDIKQELTQDAGSGRPSAVAPYLDDNNGNITFRFMPGVPDQNYTATITYQKQPVLMTALTSIWPIPDRYGFVYQQGFLGMMYLFADDMRSAFMLQKFMAGLLAVAEGLTEQERNAFMDNWKFAIESQRASAKAGQGLTARAAS
jgi:hypothetical protein